MLLSRNLIGSNGIQGKMRKGLREQVSSALRRVAAALLALTVLSALEPPAQALAVTAESAARDCCIVPPASCDGPGAACPQQQLCKADSSAAGEYAQTPGFTAAIPETQWRKRAVTLPELAVKPGLAVAQSGPPAYLRFHRFLL
jgi:hypothetical protein